MNKDQDAWAYGLVRDGRLEGVEKSHAVALHWVNAEIVPLVPMRQRDEFAGKCATLEAVLAESRANDMAAMGWLADCRFAVGDNGKRMLPEFVDYLKDIKKQRDDLLAAMNLIAWESASYVESTAIAKEAIGQTGIIPQPPSIASVKGGAA